MRVPQGRHHARGLEAPESGRFKGLRGFKRGLRGKSKSPCPLLPSPGRRPARRRLVLTKLVIIAFLSEGERTSGGAREGGGLSISPFALSGLSRIPLKRFFAGDFQSPCQKGLPLGVHGATSDAFLPRTRVARFGFYLSAQYFHTLRFTIAPPPQLSFRQIPICQTSFHLKRIHNKIRPMYHHRAD